MKKRTFTPLSVLIGALLLALVVGLVSALPFSVQGTAHAQSTSIDTTLFELSLAGSDDDDDVSALMPAFSPSEPPREGGYTTYVASDVNTLTLTATASHTAADVAVKAGATENAAAAVSGNGTYPVTLGDPGTDTVILVTVTAADTFAMATYKVTVIKGAAGSEDTELSALSLMAGSDKVELDPEFASDASETTTYAASVPYATTRVEVMATPTNRDATVAVKSDKDSNVQNNVVDLSEEANVITVTVTAADKATTRDYVVTVTRVESSLSTDTTLAALSLATATGAIPLAPRFVQGRAPTSSGYTAKVGASVAEVTLTVRPTHSSASVAVMVGADEDAAMGDDALVTDGDVYTVDANAGFQAEGLDTVILVTVTAQDEISKATYKVTLEHATLPTSSINTLSALSLMAGNDKVAITPDFDSDENAYEANVAYSTTRVEVMATPTNRGATVAVESNKDSNIQSNRVVDLSEGANVITVTVTAAAGPDTADKADDCAVANPDINIKCYIVTVTRAERAEPRITTLAALSIADPSDADPSDADPSDGTDMLSLDPAFVADRAPVADGHTAYVASSVGTLTLTATKSHAGADVAVKAGATENAAAAVSGNGTYPVTLGDPGTDTVILVTVTAADKVAMATYKVTVIKGAAGSEDTELSALSLMAGSDKVELDPEFASDASETITYAASVPYATTRVEIMATPTARDATVAVKSDKDSNVQNNVVDLSEGANVITVTVTAADKATTRDYVVTVTRVTSNLSTDTTLDVLSLGLTDATITLMPAFVRNRAPEESGYTANAAAGSVIVMANAAHTGASVAVMVMGDDGNSQVEGIASPYSVTLNAEGLDTVILVTVTASDLATTATYRITVSTPAADNDATLKELRLSLGADMDDVALTPEFGSSPNDKYRADAEVASVTVVATPTNSEATVTVTSNKDNDVQENVVDLAIGTNIIKVTVVPVSNDTPKMYEIQVMRRASDDATLSSLMLMGEPMDMMEGASIDLMDMDDMTVEFMADTTMYYASVASDVDKIVVVPMKMHSAAMVSVMYGAGMSADMDAMMVDVESYWNMLGCPAMNDAVGADDQPDDPTSPYCRMYDGLDEDPKMKVDEAYKYHYSVSLMEGENTVEVMVTAEDGTATETYTVMVTVGMATLLDRYDADESGHIDLSEVNKAIDDYFDDLISLANVNTVIDLYFE